MVASGGVLLGEIKMVAESSSAPSLTVNVVVYPTGTPSLATKVCSGAGCMELFPSPNCQSKDKGSFSTSLEFVPSKLTTNGDGPKA